MNKIHLRSALKTDHDFIINSWVNNYQRTSYMAISIKKDTFMRNHAFLIYSLLQKPEVKIIIAGDGTDFTINGYVVYEDPSLIHFVYVRESMRRLGILKAMLSELNIQSAESSHWNRWTQDMYSKYKNISYNPYPFYCTNNKAKE